MDYRAVVALLLTPALLPAIGSAAETTPELPRRIVLTEADCRDINRRHTLRGRKLDEGIFVIHRTADEVWDGLQVFTGRRADVIAWLRTHDETLAPFGGFQNQRSMRAFQYDLLCSGLLHSGDRAIIDAVLRHTRPTGSYVEADWQALLEDQRLNTTQRVLAWVRLRERKPVGRTEAAGFRQRFSRTLTWEHLLDAAMARPFPWSVFQVSEEVGLTAEKADAMLVPLLRREYLGVGGGRVMRGVIQSLRRVHGPRDQHLTRLLLQRLRDWDAQGDARSKMLWLGLRTHHFDAETAPLLREWAQQAVCPDNAARAFWLYTATDTGAAALQQPGEWQRMLQDYLVASAAFSREQGALRLHRIATPPDRLLKVLSEYGVRLRVDEKQKTLLEQAWRHCPAAWKHFAPTDTAQQTSGADPGPKVTNGR